MESTESSPTSSESPPTPETFPLAIEEAGDVLSSDSGLAFIAEAGGPSVGEAATIDEPHLPVHAELSIWQQPFTQKVLPWMTSILLHLGIFLVFLLSYKVVQVFHQKEVEQYIVPDSSLTEGQEGGIPHPGVGGDPTRDAAQDKFPDVADVQGISENKGQADLQKLLNGGGESASDLATGANSTIGRSQKSGSGLGAGLFGDSGEGSPAPYGMPGGGEGMGPKSSFAGLGGNARRIVYVLDATGSMMSAFDDLRAVLRQSLAGLRPPQAVNVIFIQENAPPPPSPTLLLVTPDNKKLVEDYVDRFTPRGPTDPLPALTKAFAMHPQLIYFLIDPSDFPDKNAVIDLVHRNAAGGKVKMNIYAFEGHDAENEKFLSKLAGETGGDQKFLSGSDLRKYEGGIGN